MQTSINFLHLWRKSLENNNNTYKFALGLSLLKHINNGRKEISFNEITSDYIEFYWNQALIYKIKHSVSEQQVPLVIQKIRALAPPQYYSLPYAKASRQKDFNKEELIKQVFSRKAILRNPISRFQTDVQVLSPDGDPQGEGWLYEWNEYDQKIIINEEAAKSIEASKHLFYEVVIFKAVCFLEQFNFTPRLTQKITLEVKRQAISQALRALFLSNAAKCFYCQTPINEGNFHLDHFIPWEYILSNDPWNLVLSCPPCNNGPGGKFISLAPEHFLRKIKERNERDFQSLKIYKQFTTPSEVNERVNDLYSNAMKSGYQVWRPRT